jgi:hypothetical protein
MKGDPKLYAATLIVAGVAGGITGATVESATVATQVGIAVAVGVVTGGLLYTAVRILRRRGPS